MLFFRSEELVLAWCRDNDTPLRPRVSIPQLWGLASAWYATRLSPESRRPKPDEMRVIFEGLGLTGPFWDPRSDAFG
jgi:hypothetical protein